MSRLQIVPLDLVPPSLKFSITPLVFSDPPRIKHSPHFPILNPLCKKKLANFIITFAPVAVGGHVIPGDIVIGPFKHSEQNGYNKITDILVTLSWKSRLRSRAKCPNP
jgi:hypothetical protein